MLIVAYTAVQTYLAELVVAKRANPTDDLLSDLTDEELRGMVLLVAPGVAIGAWTTDSTWLLSIVLADWMRRVGHRGPFEIALRRLSR
ncbi:hypothetical protein [Nonomuraea angiospora]|uniref:hypothetical protein n=1 Tax=Nonomuraea angiospora TaxID=46172 RepID=UPI003F55F285